MGVTFFFFFPVVPKNPPAPGRHSWRAQKEEKAGSRTECRAEPLKQGPRDAPEPHGQASFPERKTQGWIAVGSPELPQPYEVSESKGGDPQNLPLTHPLL